MKIKAELLKWALDEIITSCDQGYDYPEDTMAEAQELLDWLKDKDTTLDIVEDGK